MVIAVVKVNLKDLQLELGGAIVASSGCNIRGNSFVITHTIFYCGHHRHHMVTAALHHDI